MPRFTLEEVLSATDGQLLLRTLRRDFTGVSTDTRTLQPGDLFFALKGEHHDGHRYLKDAQQKGAAGAVVADVVPGVRRRHTDDGDWILIEVTDTLYALGKLARYNRNRSRIPVIAVTGSVGKTTTKEMTAAILEQYGPVLKSHANYNNEIGLPQTLLQLTSEHTAAVLELGMRGRGQIAYLTSLCRPTVGVITNIGLSHLEYLGTPEEIAQAKAELLDSMSPTATAVLPADDAFFPLLQLHARGPVVTVGNSESCDVWASATLPDDDGCPRFILHAGGETAPIRLGVPGRHQVANAMMAAGAALKAGATLRDVVTGLGGYRATEGRMRVLRAPAGYTVIDDSYNANPAAVRATLEFLAELPGVRKVAVLGDMRELGPAGPAQHREMGAYAMRLGVDALFAVGELGKEYVAGADDPRAVWYPDNESAAEAARALLHGDRHSAASPHEGGDVVLVKGSRAMGMESIVEALTA